MSLGNPLLEDERSVILQQDIQCAERGRGMLYADPSDLQERFSSVESFEEIHLDASVTPTSSGLNHQTSQLEREEFLSSQVNEYILVGVGAEGEDDRPVTAQVREHLSSSGGDLISEDIDGSTTEVEALSTSTKKDIGVSQSQSNDTFIHSQSSLNQSQGELHTWYSIMYKLFCNVQVPYVIALSYIRLL